MAKLDDSSTPNSWCSATEATLDDEEIEVKTHVLQKVATLEESASKSVYEVLFSLTVGMNLHTVLS